MAWVWEGGTSDDFFDSGNWYDCGALDGPTSDLSIHFGPAFQLLDGMFGSIEPLGPATLAQSFSSPSLEMLSNTDTELTVDGVTYSTDAVIGRRSTGFDHAGVATLRLRNAIFDGAITLAADDGNGRLILDGESTAADISIGDGTATIQNQGAFTLTSPVDGLSTSATLLNEPGAVLTLDMGSNIFSAEDEDDFVVNGVGATIAVADGVDANIGWNIVNDGLIRIPQGSMNLPKGITYQGSGTILVGPSSTLTMGPALLGENVDIIAEGGGTVALNNVSGPATLTLIGHASVTGPRLETDLINTGDAEITGRIWSPNSTTTWTNVSGSCLTLLWGDPFRVGSRDDFVINEAGATIIKPGDSIATIRWPIINNGLIRVIEGRMNLPFTITYEGTGSIVVEPLATLFLALPVLGDNADVVVEPGGTVKLGGVSGPGTLTLTGDARISGNFLGTDLINAGNAEITEEFDGTYYAGTWINSVGSTLTLGFQSPFINPVDNDDFIVNETGATVTLPEGAEATIGWPITNNGLIDARSGALTFSAPLEWNGELRVGHGGTASLDTPDPALKAPSASLSGTGRFQTTAPALLNRGIFTPSPRDPTTNPDGLTIDVPFIQNTDTAVFRTQIGSLAGKLTCTGIVDIGGTIDIQRFGDFEPDGTEEFVVLEAEFVSGVFGDYFTNAVPPMGSDTAFGVRTGDLKYDLTYTPTQLIVSNIEVIVPPCNPADIAEPAGLLDLADITAFVTAFAAGDEAADLAPPQGLLDLADISVFVSAFTAGCP